VLIVKGEGYPGSITRRRYKLRRGGIGRNRLRQDSEKCPESIRNGGPLQLGTVSAIVSEWCPASRRNGVHDGSEYAHQPSGEIPGAERCVESLFGGSEGAGRNKVNASASSDYQPKGVREGRAAHVTAKATHSVPAPERTLGLLGVWAAARYEGMMRNRRDPPLQPTSGKDRAYKAGAEVARSREGVRGVRTTVEGGEKPLEGRDPASVTFALGVSARAWP